MLRPATAIRWGGTGAHPGLWAHNEIVAALPALVEAVVTSLKDENRFLQPIHPSTLRKPEAAATWKTGVMDVFGPAIRCSTGVDALANLRELLDRYPEVLDEIWAKTRDHGRTVELTTA